MNDRARSRNPSRDAARLSDAVRNLAGIIFGWLDDNAVFAVIFVLVLNVAVFLWLPSIDKKYMWAYFLAGFNLGAIVFCLYKFRMRRQ